MRPVLLACGLALALVGCAGPSVPTLSTGVASGAPSDEPSAVPSTAPSSAPSAKPSHTPAPTPKPIAVCLATQLAAKVTSWSGATGHQIASVTLTNTSTHTCTVQGTPEVELVDAHGIILIDSQTSGASGLPHVAKGAPAFHLAHLGSVKTLVDADNYCLAAPKLPTTVAFVLPANAGRLVATPGPGGTVPPCTRTPGSLGTISMNGWKK